MTLGCHPTRRSPCETVSEALILIGVHGAADVENGYGTLTVRDAGTGRWNMLLAASSSRGLREMSPERQQRLRSRRKCERTLEVRNRFGNITAQSIQGAVTITGGNGSVDLMNAGPTNITTSFGMCRSAPFEVN